MKNLPDLATGAAMGRRRRQSFFLFAGLAWPWLSSVPKLWGVEDARAFFCLPAVLGRLAAVCLLFGASKTARRIDAVRMKNLLD